ncbi:MAG: cell surface protein SprA, partial [Syntrophothermus sp.]
KVRIGEEPLNNSIYGIDFGTSADLPFVTKGLDKLFSTREMSSLSLRGDFAFINPDPNTKKSPITSDGGESIAYVDDFEGSKKTIPLGLGYTSWHDLSYPNDMKGMSSDPNTIMGYKAKSWWYNITPSDVQTTAIWPQKKVSKNDRSVTVLDYVFEPSMRGTYNFNTNFVPNSPQNWGGIMKVLSSTANNLEDENIEFIEFWMQIEGRDPKNSVVPSDILYIDLGKISEDVIPNNRLDTEDKPAGQGNGLLDNGEDVGIDGQNDDQERAEHKSTESDPAGDDFEFTPVGPDPKNGYYNSDAYQKINGTENNSKSIEAGKLPDTEDLKNTLTLETVNSYFRYAIPLDTSRANNKYIVGGGNTDAKWYQIRIPLKDISGKFGSPSLSVVEYIRLWMNNSAHRVHLRFADFNLVGSQWQKVTPSDIKKDSTSNGQDKKLELSVISIDENSPEYYPPPGVSKEKDLSKPDEDVFRNEQSLNMIIHNLGGKEERQVIKTVRAMDLFNYKALKLFIHGDVSGTVSPSSDNLSNFDNPTPEGHNADVYFRFGADTTNYYEFKQPVKPGWNEINIPFAEITALKAARDAAKDSSKNFYQKPYYSQVPGEVGHYYGIRGNPSLTSVNFFLIGVKNPKDSSSMKFVSGKIWVDEMRVIGADNHPGWAASGSIALKLADVANVSFNMSQTDPYFHKLADRFGSRMDSRNWSVALDLDVIKIMPFDMPGSKMRLNYQRSESISKPLYKPGTDIKLENASQELERQMLDRGRSSQQAAASRDSAMSVSQTLNVSETWSLSSIELRIPSTFWLIQETVNNLRFNFSFNKTEGRNPTVSSNKSWIWNFGASYSLTFGQNNFIYLADIPVFGTVLQLFTDYRNTKFYYSPQNLSLNLTTSRNYSYSLSRIAGVTPSVSRDFRQSRNGAFQWKLTDGGLLNLAIGYNVDISASLAHLLTVNNVFDRREKEIWRDFIGSQFFGRPFQYSQNFDLRTSPKLPTLWNLNNYFTINAGYNSSYSWANNFQQTYAGRSAGYASKINFGLKVKLKSLFEPLFKEEIKEDSELKQGENNRGNSNRQSRARSREEDEIPGQDKVPGGREIAKADSLAKTDSLSVLAVKKDSTVSAPSSLKLKAVWSAFKSGVKFALFDYENITLNFSQDNTLQKNGIKGEGTGFNNFWGVFRNNNNGPSRLFMLGIGSDVGPRVSAPDTGAQAITVSLSDNYSQRNSIDFGTQKPLWEGAQLDLKWKVGWSMNKNTVFQVDKFGAVTGSTVTANGTLSRSFVALPPLPLLGNSGIKKVKELYTGNNLSEAFLQGFESFPLLSKIPFLNKFTRYIPRPNWTLNWDGLEKISVFKSFAKRVSLNHAYSAEYSEGWMLNTQGTQVTQSQKINYGFQPLIGLTMTFNSLWNGNMTGNMKYST